MGCVASCCGNGDRHASSHGSEDSSDCLRHGHGAARNLVNIRVVYDSLKEIREHEKITGCKSYFGNILGPAKTYKMGLSWRSAKGQTIKTVTGTRAVKRGFVQLKGVRFLLQGPRGSLTGPSVPLTGPPVPLTGAPF